jgi:hypothetical protein
MLMIIIYPYTVTISSAAPGSLETGADYREDPCDQKIEMVRSQGVFREAQPIGSAIQVHKRRKKWTIRRTIS